MSSATIVVTGANRGIGLGIVNLIAKESTAYTVYITSRSGSDLPTPSSNSTFLPRKLDISDGSTVESFAAEIKEAHPDGIDAVINNAGVNLNPEGYSEETIRNTMKINFYGTKAMCDAFIPLVKKGGRVVNVASVGGHLNGYSADIKKKIQEAASSTAGLMDLVSEYEFLVAKKQEVSAGFRKDAYCVSKAFVVALTKALAAENTGLQINSCCPGWVDTDMGLQIGKPPKSLEDGGRIPLRLAVGDIGNSSGEFWENQSISSTADGKWSRVAKRFTAPEEYLQFVKSM